MKRFLRRLKHDALVSLTDTALSIACLHEMGAWSQKVAAMIKESHGIELSVMRNIGGNNDEWHFMTSHDSLAALESYTAAVTANEAFYALAREAIEQKLWHSTRDNLFRSAF